MRGGIAARAKGRLELCGTKGEESRPKSLKSLTNYIYIIKVYVYDLPISLDCRYDDNDDEIMILS